MKKIFNICNLYIFICCLYFFHWYATGQVPILERLANMFLGINWAISLYATIVVMSRYRVNRLMKSMLVVVAVFIIYGLFSIIRGEVIVFSGVITINNGTYLIAPLRTFLPVFTFYLFTKMGLLTENVIQWWVAPFIVLCIFCFYAAQFVRYGEAMDDLFTNGAGYLFAALFPFVYFFRNKPIIQYALVGGILFFAVLALKRGAILVALVCFLYFFFDKMKNTKRSRLLWTTILITVVLVSVWNLSKGTLLSSDSFQDRVEQTIEGNDSNRSNLRHIQLSAYANGSIIQLLFGFGADGSLKISPNYAHNDWIEVLVDQGLFGFFIYFIFWLTFFFTWRRSKWDLLVFNILGMLFLSGMLRTFFSMWYSNSNMFVSLPLGYCLALMTSRQIEKPETIKASTDVINTSK